MAEMSASFNLRVWVCESGERSQRQILGVALLPLLPVTAVRGQEVEAAMNAFIRGLWSPKGHQLRQLSGKVIAVEVRDVRVEQVGAGDKGTNVTDTLRKDKGSEETHCLESDWTQLTRSLWGPSVRRVSVSEM